MSKGKTLNTKVQIRSRQKARDSIRGKKKPRDSIVTLNKGTFITLLYNINITRFMVECPGNSWSTSIEKKTGKMVVVDLTTLKMATKPVKLQKESPEGCAGVGKQSMGN